MLQLFTCFHTEATSKRGASSLLIWWEPTTFCNSKNNKWTKVTRIMSLPAAAAVICFVAFVCPTASALSITAPTAGDEFRPNDIVNITWSGSTSHSAFRIYLMADMSYSVSFVIDAAADATLGHYEFRIPPYGVPGTYWIAVVPSSGLGIVLAGAVTNRFEILSGTCTSHAQCRMDQFCHRSDVCYLCNQCTTLTSTNGWCPTKCGAMTYMALGDAWPTATENSATGVPQSTALSSVCERADLIDTSIDRVEYSSLESNSTWSATQMTPRLGMMIDIEPKRTV